MKKLGLSLITAAALISSATASSSLVEALTTNSKIGGEVNFFYTAGSQSNVARLPAPHNNVNSGMISAELDYESGTYNNFNFGMTGRLGWDLGFHDNLSEDDNRNTVTSQEISRLYLKYAYNSSEVTLGRQYIQTPLLLDGDQLWIMRDSFDALDVKIKEIPNTLLQLTYVDKWNKIYADDSNGTASEDDISFDNGLWSIYVKNNSIKSLVLDAQYMNAGEPENPTLDNGDGPIKTIGAYEQYFVRGEYKLPIDHFVKVGASYAQANFDVANSVGADEAYYAGAKITTKVGPFTLIGGYSTISDDRDYPGSVGSFADKVVATGAVDLKTFYAGVDAYSLQANYKVNDNVSTFFKVVHGELSNEAKNNFPGTSFDTFNEYILNTNVNLSSITKGLSARFVMVYTEFNGDYKALSAGPDYDAGNDDSDHLYGRVYLTYKF